MKLTLKKFESFERGSEETVCFGTDVYLDNVKIGTAENAGKGGCTHFRPAAIFPQEQVEKYVAELKAAPADWHKFEVTDKDCRTVDRQPRTLSEVIENMANELHVVKLVKKQISQICSTAFLVLHRDKLSSMRPKTEEAKAQIKMQYPGATIVNDMKPDERFEACRKFLM